MKVITYAATRQNPVKMMENVCRDHAPVIVTRKAAGSAVIISPEDYEALEEAAYPLGSVCMPLLGFSALSPTAP